MTVHQKRKKNTIGVKKYTKFQEQLMQCPSLITEGQLLVIDPSSGSTGSMPGYAVMQRGVLTEYGTISLPAGLALHRRLQELSKTLLEEFEIPSVLVVEHIAPMIGGKGGVFGAGKSVLNLHKSVGVVIASIRCPHVFELSPNTWHAYLKRLGIASKYVKCDVNDAIIMARVTVVQAFELIGREPPAFDYSILFKENK